MRFGGTALAIYYFQHRLSFDIDRFDIIKDVDTMKSANIDSSIVRDIIFYDYFLIVAMLQSA